MEENKKQYKILWTLAIACLCVFAIFYVPHTSETTITLMAYGNKNELSKGSEIWLTGIEINGESTSLNDYSLTGNWKSINGNIVYIYDPLEENKNLVLQFSNATNICLIFSKHAWSGLVGIEDGHKNTEVDLYEQWGQFEYHVGNIVPFEYSLTKLFFGSLLIIILAYLSYKILSCHLKREKRQAGDVIFYIFNLLLIESLLGILQMKNLAFGILLLLALGRIVLFHKREYAKSLKEYIGLWGIVLICWFYRIYYLHNSYLKSPTIVYLVLLGLFMFFLIGPWREKRWSKYIVTFFTPILCLCIIESVSNVNMYALSLNAIVINFILIALCNIIIVNLFDYKNCGWYLVYVLSFVISVVNYYVIQFKKFALMPADILQFKTAIAVAADYRYELSSSIITGLLFLLLSFVLTKLYVPLPTFKLKNILLRKGVAICGIIVFSFWMCSINFTDEYHIEKNDWDTSVTYSQNGFLLSFISYSQSMYPDKPESYTDEKARGILERYSESENIILDEKPTIIAIMNESFSDLNDLGDLGNTHNVMWFMDSYDKFLEKGRAYVSVRGGGTCNSEFEFLTGNSMQFFADSYPYTQYGFNDAPTLVSSLKEQGYYAIAMHPANPTNYKRQTVYQQMGFNEFYSYSDYEDYERVFLDRVSDSDDYKKIIEVVDASSEPLFVFNVTIQNHGEYNFDTLNTKYPLIDVDSKYSSFKDLQMYLTLMNESSKALEHLIQHFEKESKPVIICFFGDHQPGCLSKDFETEFFEYNDEQSELFNTERYYATPYFFWANYDIGQKGNNEKELDAATSPNYLAMQLLNYAGLQKTPYEKFLEEMKKNIIVINRFGYLGNDGTWYSYTDTSPYLSWIEEYHTLQYYNMFEK